MHEQPEQLTTGRQRTQVEPVAVALWVGYFAVLALIAGWVLWNALR